MATNTRNLLLLLLLPAAYLVFYTLSEKHEQNNPSAGKEKYYLPFNKDEIFINVVQVEGHFRNVKDLGVDTGANFNCNVKHLADAEGHAAEAISHSLVVDGVETSRKFSDLRNGLRDFRHEMQNGNVTAEEGIKRIRALRREFESFNPDYDISKCTACTIVHGA